MAAKKPYVAPRSAFDLIPTDEEDLIANRRNGRLAEQQNSKPGKRTRRNADVTSWGIQARHDLRDAARILAVKRGMTMGRIIEEAIIDLLRKHGEPVPGEGNNA